MSKFNVGDTVRIIGPVSGECGEYETESGERVYFAPMMKRLLGRKGRVLWYDEVYKTYKVEVHGEDIDFYYKSDWLQLTKPRPHLGDPASPEHYRVSDIEPIDAIEAWELGFCLGNVVKYVARHAHKGDPLGDLKKAAWYLDRAIKEMEK